MPADTKITLSADELSLVQNAEWILTKQRITDKVYELFALQIPIIEKTFFSNVGLPLEIRTSVPKIYKGEQYRQLPYVMLDYPRCFGKENIFAVRTMFWWAKFFSITLHVAGSYKSLIKENIFAGDFFVSTNENQWEHHFGEDNFIRCTRLSTEKMKALFDEREFIKIAMKFDLDKWNEMPALLQDAYTQINQLLINSRGGERDLLPGIPTTGFDL